MCNLSPFSCFGNAPEPSICAEKAEDFVAAMEMTSLISTAEIFFATPSHIHNILVGQGVVRRREIDGFLNSQPIFIIHKPRIGVKERKRPPGRLPNGLFCVQDPGKTLQ